MLTNPGFECSEGTYTLDAPLGGSMRIHQGWTVVFLDGTPWVHSASMQFNRGTCGGDAHVEKIEGADSLAIFAHDLEWTDAPGKPFDVAVYQQVQVTPGTAYSLSAWLLSLCGGSTVPNDCPGGVYMAKRLGIDPTGGVDPRADTVIWVEDRHNFVEDGQRVGWRNLRLGAVAESETITVFARVHSPFQWHGNHAFIDAFSLVEAPRAGLAWGGVDPADSTPAQVAGDHVDVSWHGAQSDQIASIPGGIYTLTFDLETRVGEEGAWQPWLSDQPAGAAIFHAQQANVPHYLRVRARAEQPRSANGGAWPNHRYPGVWSQPISVIFSQAPQPQSTIFLPNVQAGAAPAPAPDPAPEAACPPTSDRVYTLIPVEAPPADHPADLHGDLNLALRGYVAVEAARQLVEVNGPADGDAPQLPGLFVDGRTPQFTSTHRVYAWDWTCGEHGCRSEQLAPSEVSLLGLETAPEEPLAIPTRGPEIYGGGYKVLVLYAAEDRITLGYTRRDSVAPGYAVHVEKACVDPNLLARYRQANDAGRGELPALRAGEIWSTARTDEILVAIRDRGTFMEPRSRKDWWQGR